MPDLNISDLIADPMALLGAAVLSLIALILVLRKIRNVGAGKIADALTGPVMFGGMIWSADAVWILTGEQHMNLPTPLRIAMFAVLEFMMLVAMLRAKDSMDRLKHTGAHGVTVWLIASLIAVFGFILGLYEGGLVVALFRPIVPLMLAKLWWDGIRGDGNRKAGSFKWTPRNLLIALGAIEADERDVREVNRDRLISQMVTVHRRWSNAKADSGRRDRLEAKLTRLSEKADDTVISEVRERRARSAWFTTAHLAQEPSAQDLAHLAHLLAQQPAHSLAHPSGAQKLAVEMPPARRAKTPAHATTSKNEAVAHAAQLVMSGEVDSIRAAAKTTGAPESSVRDHIRKLRADDTSRAPESAQPAQKPINGHPVLAGTGPTHQEN